MNKKIMYFVAFLIMLCVGYLLNYFNQYHIEDDNISIESNLKFWLNRNRGSEEELKPNVIETVQLDGTTSYFTLFKLEKENYGHVHLIKGVNGKFKVQGLGYGTGLYNPSSFQIIDTNKGKYMVLYGGNPILKINHITAKSTLEEFGFTSDVSKNENFVKYEKIPSNVEKPFLAKLIFYDKSNNEIKFKTN